MVLQFYLVSRGINLGPVQIFAFVMSFVTLNLTSAEWHYYDLDLVRPVPMCQMFIRAFKVTPFFLLPIVYKTMILALLFAILKYYAFICIVILLVFQFIIHKRAGFLGNEKAPSFIFISSIFYNLCTIARPGYLNTDNWNSKTAGLFRLETWGSLLLHIIFASIATILYDFELIELDHCAFGWFKDYVSTIASFVLILAATNAVVAEIYLSWFPHILFPERDEEELDYEAGCYSTTVSYRVIGKGLEPKSV